MDLQPIKIGVINTYNEEWYDKCLCGESSRGHLWGMDALMERGHDVRQITTRDGSRAARFGAWLTRITRHRVADFASDFAAIKAARRFDLIYISNGGFGSVYFYLILKRFGLIRTKIVVWKYEQPRRGTFPLGLFARVYNHFFRAMDGVCCLTKRAESAYRALYANTLSRYIAWGADVEFVKPASGIGTFFLSSGATRRDVETIIKAANEAKAPCVILGPEALEPLAGPTVRYIARRKGVHPHDTISDEELHKLYNDCRAILIPLFDIPDDTSGLTNILEALASGKPVIKTKAGSLDIDLEVAGAGIHTRPGNVNDWVRAFDALMEDATAAAMSIAARQAALDYFNTTRFGRDVVAFIEEVALEHATVDPLTTVRPDASPSPVPEGYAQGGHCSNTSFRD